MSPNFGGGGGGGVSRAVFGGSRRGGVSRIRACAPPQIRGAGAAVQGDVPDPRHRHRGRAAAAEGDSTPQNPLHFTQKSAPQSRVPPPADLRREDPSPGEGRGLFHAPSPPRPPQKNPGGGGQRRAARHRLRYPIFWERGGGAFFFRGGVHLSFFSPPQGRTPSSPLPTARWGGSAPVWGCPPATSGRFTGW